MFAYVVPLISCKHRPAVISLVVRVLRHQVSVSHDGHMKLMSMSLACGHRDHDPNGS